MQVQKFSQNLVGAFNEGRDFAVARFFESYYPELKLKVQRIVGMVPDAEDLASEIFYKMLKSEGKFETVKNIENYLRLITETMCRDFKQRRRTPVIKMEAVREFYLDIEDDAFMRSEIISTTSAVHSIANEMLPPQCREVYILHYIRGMRIREIAEWMGKSEKTIENQINIANGKLRKECQKDGGRMFLIKFLLPLFWV